MMTSNGAPYRHQELCLGTKEIDTPQEEIEAERFNKLLPHHHSGEGPDCIFFKLFDTLQKQFKLENHSFFLPVQWWGRHGRVSDRSRLWQQELGAAFSHL